MTSMQLVSERLALNDFILPDCNFSAGDILNIGFRDHNEKWVIQSTILSKLVSFDGRKVVYDLSCKDFPTLRIQYSHRAGSVAKLKMQISDERDGGEYLPVNTVDLFQPLIVSTDIASQMEAWGLASLPDEQVVNFEKLVQDFESRIVVRALQSTRGNISRASKRLKLKNSKLYSKIRALKIDPKVYKVGL